jgi:hypothetical protein
VRGGREGNGGPQAAVDELPEGLRGGARTLKANRTLPAQGGVTTTQGRAVQGGLDPVNSAEGSAGRGGSREARVWPGLRGGQP